MNRHLRNLLLLSVMFTAIFIAAGCGSDLPAPVLDPAPTIDVTPAPAAAPEPAATDVLSLSTTGVVTDQVQSPEITRQQRFDVTIWAPVAGFLEQQTLQQNADILDEVNFFWYTLARDGSIEGGIQAAEAVRVARETGLRVVPSILNGGFDRQRVADIIQDPARRAQHIADILALIRDNDFDGIDIDYESLYPEDRDDFSLFIEELSEAMQAEGKLLSIAVHAKTDDAGAWSGPAAQDWARLGAAVDEFKIMTYDYHSGGSEAGPIAPLDWVDDVLTYAATVVPPEKTWMGVPFYGYDWSGSIGKSLNWRQAVKLAEQNGAVIQRDPTSAEAWFSYSDGKQTVYFNDAETMMARLDIMRNNHPDIAGIAIWPLGGEDPANWTTIRESMQP